MKNEKIRHLKNVTKKLVENIVYDTMFFGKILPISKIREVRIKLTNR